MLVALLWGFIAGGALLIGAGAAWVARPSRALIALIMAFGAGVLISAVAFDLMDEAAASGGALAASLGFLAGALLFVAGDWALSAAGGGQRKSSHGAAHDESQSSGLAIAFGALLDGVPESLVIGISLIAGEGVALATVIAIFLSNLPEGLSSAAGMKAAGRGPAYVFGIWGAVATACALSSWAGFALFDDAPAEAIAFVQALAGGAIIAMIVNTMIPEAFEKERALTGLATALGFLAAFTLSHTL